MGKYSARGWQHWPDQQEDQYRTRELNISLYCPNQESTIINLLYDWTCWCLHLLIATVNECLKSSLR